MARKPKALSDSPLAADAAPTPIPTPDEPAEKPRARRARKVSGASDASADPVSEPTREAAVAPQSATKRIAPKRGRTASETGEPVAAIVAPPVAPTPVAKPPVAKPPAPEAVAPKRLGRKVASAAAEAAEPVAPAIETAPPRKGRGASKPAAVESAPAKPAPAKPEPTKAGVLFRAARTLREEAEASEESGAPEASEAPQTPKQAAPASKRSTRSRGSDETPAVERAAPASAPVVSAPVANALFGSVVFRSREGAGSRPAPAQREEAIHEESPPSATPRSEAPQRLGRRDRNEGREPRQGGRRSLAAEADGEPSAALAIEPPIADAPERGADGFPLPTFRARGEAFAAAQARDRLGDRDEAPSFDEDSRDGRRNRRGGRNGSEFEDISKGEAPARQFEDAPKAVKPEARPLIDAPEDAPQVVAGPAGPMLVRKGQVVTPFVFFADLLGAQRAETVRNELKMAAEAGVHLHAFPLTFEGTPDGVDEAAAAIEEAVKGLLAADPEAMALVRLDLQAPRGWDSRFPDGAYRAREGKLAAPSIADDRYWAEVRLSLRTLVDRLSRSSVAEAIVGLQFDRDGWILRGGYDGSAAAQGGFRKWLRVRYLNDEVMLRAAWFDGSVTFGDAEAPTRAPRATPGVRFVRAERKARRYVDYHLYLSDATVARIADLAYAVKEASGGRMLFGARYGDTFEDVSPARGQLSLGKLLRTPEVDFVSGPPSDEDRGPGGAAGVQAAVDSIALNGKLYLSELDYRTSLAGDGPGDEPGTLRSPQALDNVHSRDLGFALAHGAGTIWMDRHGRGALNTPSAWNRAEAARELLDLRLASEPDAPDVAVFLDERALAYVEDAGAFGALVRQTRDAVLRAGVSVGFYLLSDLAHRERFPESKVHIFLNAWDVRSDLRSAIKTRLQKGGKTLVWLYAAGLFDGGRDSLERVREVTGIALRPQPFASRAGTVLVDRRNPLAAAFPGGEIVSPPDLEPTYSAIPEDSSVLGEYAATGLPSFVSRRLKSEERGEEWTSVFLGEPAMNAELVRALAQGAGAHVWSFSDDVVHARPPFLTVHASSPGSRAVVLPHKWSAAYAPASSGSAWAALDASSLKLDLTEGATQSFLVGPRDAVQRLMDADVDAAKRIERIPARESNVRLDVSSFDLPIVKLEGWTAGGEASDDVAEDWFLRPQSGSVEIANQAVPVTADSEDDTTRTGRRRRRDRDGRDRDGRDRDGRDRDGRDGRDRSDRGERDRSSAKDVFASPELPAGKSDSSLNVVFRKRS